MRIKTIRSGASWLHGLTYGEMMIVLVVFSILAIMFVISSKFVVVKARHSAALQVLQTVDSSLITHRLTAGSLPTEEEGLENWS